MDIGFLAVTVSAVSLLGVRSFFIGWGWDCFPTEGGGRGRDGMDIDFLLGITVSAVSPFAACSFFIGWGWDCFPTEGGGRGRDGMDIDFLGVTVSAVSPLGACSFSIGWGWDCFSKFSIFSLFGKRGNFLDTPCSFGWETKFLCLFGRIGSFSSFSDAATFLAELGNFFIVGEARAFVGRMGSFLAGELGTSVAKRASPAVVDECSSVFTCCSTRGLGGRR